jgi:nicotinate (nicotinamide) nucleotide adenylyltransferase
MEFVRRAQVRPSRLAVFSAAFNPPTVAHLALADAALAAVDEVLFVLPRRFPHKDYDEVGLEDRLRLVLRATEKEPRFAVAVSDGGLFLEIARECRQAYRPGVELWFLCGRDAAERIAGWDYGEPGAFTRQLEEYGLLVADRGGAYEPPAAYRDRIRRLPLDRAYGDVSATMVREAVRGGLPWRHLVPPEIADDVARFYGRR